MPQPHTEELLVLSCMPMVSAASNLSSPHMSKRKEASRRDELHKVTPVTKNGCHAQTLSAEGDLRRTVHRPVLVAITLPAEGDLRQK